MTRIEWTQRTAMVDRGGRRIRYYERRRPNGPGAALRREMLLFGLKWCRRCQAWLLADEIGRSGLCRPHRNEVYREGYRANPDIRAQKLARKRHTAVVPPQWWRQRQEEFGGLCAYGCGRAGTTRDHVIPIKLGGLTTPGNIVPACPTCNSSKRASDPWQWIERGFAAFPDAWTATIELAEAA